MKIEGMIQSRFVLGSIVLAAMLSSALTAGAIFVMAERGVLASANSVLPGIPNTGSIPDVVEQVNQSVVSIIVSRELPVIERRMQEFDPFGFSIPVYVQQEGTEEVEIGGGSGFVVQGGYIVTNKHVVSLEDAAYTVITNDGKRHTAEVVYRDPDADVAVVAINATYPSLSIGNSDEIQIGQTVIAIGNALTEFSNTVSVGVISGLGRSIRAIDPVARTVEEIDEVIQTDAAINRGNSGGPLLDAAGSVIGMNVAVSADAENIGFAIPANEIQRVLDRVR